MNKRLRVAIVGATGLAGQQFVSALTDHPYFQIVALASSERSSGKTYQEAITDPSGAFKWYQSTSLPAFLSSMKVQNAKHLSLQDVDIVFSAMETDAATEIEPQLAAEVPVFSTASAFRYEQDVPLLLPGVNPEHIPLLHTQKKNRGWKGFLLPLPNCTVTGLCITLKPILDTFGIERVMMTSLQACSGAGRMSGVLGLDILDNVIPYIPKEEEKVEVETRKILGSLIGKNSQQIDNALIHQNTSLRLTPHPLSISCTCTRVPVIEGHTEAVFVATKQAAPLSKIKQALENFGKNWKKLKLPSVPKPFISVHEDPYRPQPRLDRDTGAGMTTVVGRLRKEQTLGEFGVKYVLVSHNTKMGAAQGAILLAEYFVVKELFHEFCYLG